MPPQRDGTSPTASTSSHVIGSASLRKYVSLKIAARRDPTIVGVIPQPPNTTADRRPPDCVAGARRRRASPFAPSSTLVHCTSPSALRTPWVARNTENGDGEEPKELRAASTTSPLLRLTFGLWPKMTVDIHARARSTPASPRPRRSRRTSRPPTTSPSPRLPQTHRPTGPLRCSRRKSPIRRHPSLHARRTRPKTRRSTRRTACVAPSSPGRRRGSSGCCSAASRRRSPTATGCGRCTTRRATAASSARRSCWRTARAPTRRRTTPPPRRRCTPRRAPARWRSRASSPPRSPTPSSAATPTATRRPRRRRRRPRRVRARRPQRRRRRAVARGARGAQRARRRRARVRGALGQLECARALLNLGAAVDGARARRSR